MSKEHVIPRWVSKILIRDRRGMVRPITMRLHSGGAVLREMTGSHAINVVMRRVCKICNEDWMEWQLEHPVQPILGPMISGRNTRLDGPAQARLAAWVAKVAMVARYAHQPPEPVEADWLDYLYRNYTAPDTWYIWTASYNGRRPVFYEGRDITLSLPDGGVTTPHGVLMSLIIGDTAFKVLGLRNGIPENTPGTSHLFQIWPPTDQAVEWPPEYQLDDASLPGFVYAYLDKPGEAIPPLPD